MRKTVNVPPQILKTEVARTKGLGRSVHILGSRLVNALRSCDEAVLALALQLGFSVCFLFSHKFSPFWGSEIATMISGLISLILIPGALTSTVMLPLKSRGLFSTLTLGVVVQLVGFQLLLSAVLLALPSFDVVFWTTIVSCIAVVACALHLRLRGTNPSLGVAFALPKSRLLLVFLAAGLIIRLLVYSASAGGLAPDAALYSDYARSLISGGMQSSVENDEVVVALALGVDYIAHHTITFFFALSWLIVLPSGNAPTALLVLVGMAIILAVYEITDSLAGSRAAGFVLCVLAVQPIFVFHSAVAYGPESLSLLLALLCMRLWIVEPYFQKSKMLLSGLLVGIVESVWFTNFYVLCVVLCIVMPVWLKMHGREWIVFSVLVLMLFIARAFSKNLVVFLLLWTVVTLAFFLRRIPSVAPTLGGTRPFFLGAFVSILFWSWPIQLKSVQTAIVQLSPPNPLGNALLAPVSITLVTNFLLFIAIHVSVPLMVAVLISIRHIYHTPNALATLFAAAVISVGTLKVLALYPGSLEVQYIFSDSRFFLFLIVLFVIVASTAFERFATLSTEESHGRLIMRQFMRRNQKTLAVGIVILIGFAPGYLAIPAGLDLVNYEQRYGWSGLESILSAHGIENGTFLADRAREFSWYTGSRSVVLRLTSIGLPSINASEEMAGIAKRFNASHLVIDGYTIAHWKTLEYLYSDEMPIGTVLPLNVSTVFDLPANETGSIPSIRLVASTEGESDGEYVRIFSFCDERFEISERIEFLSPGWEATDSGSITNHSGTAAFEIASNGTYTSVWRPGGYDLNMTIGSGVLLMRFLGTGANVTRVEVWDKDGQLLRYADALGEGRFACGFGETTIGDVRVVVEGTSGGYVLVTSASIWTHAMA